MMVKSNRVLSGWGKTPAQCLLLALLAVSLVGCSQAPAVTKAPPPTEAVIVQAPTATMPPAPTATPAPTETPVPSATPTELPTATPVPPLALVENGFTAWCAPISYEGMKPSSPEAVTGANMLTSVNNKMQVKIPAAYCALTFRFNQAAPSGAKVSFFEGKSQSPFLNASLNPVDGHPDEVWASVNHRYVINPPLWEVTYRVALVGADGQELWSNPVRFAKPTPKNCPYGGLPDPVTLYCAVTDPWEIEPWPDVTYPYDRTALPPE